MLGSLQFGFTKAFVNIRSCVASPIDCVVLLRQPSSDGGANGMIVFVAERFAPSAGIEPVTGFGWFEMFGSVAQLSFRYCASLLAYSVNSGSNDEPSCVTMTAASLPWNEPYAVSQYG